jgi:hypothetical protein
MMRWALTTLVATLCHVAAACAAGGEGPADQAPADVANAPDADEVAVPGNDAEDAAADVTAAADAANELASEPAPEWTLPPCYRACDRVVACGVEACNAYEWPSAGILFEGCFEACDEGRAGQVLDAAGRCAGVLDAVRPWVTELEAAACDGSPCELACRHMGECMVAACTGYADLDLAGFVTGCAAGCKPDDTAWILAMPDCEALVTAIATNDPVFDATCHGTPGVCPDAVTCGHYGEKFAACVSAHCGAAAEPFLVGIRDLIAGFCAGDKNCPSVETVDALLDPAQTCVSPSFATAGKDAPFARACQGSPDVPVADLDAACTALFACGASQWLPGPDACRTLLTFPADAKVRVACVLDAGSDCTACWACLEGM